MGNAVRLAGCAALLILFAGGAFGQQGGGGGGGTRTVVRQGTITVNTSGDGARLPLAGPAIPGAPYSAQALMEHAQTLADGTHIVRQLRTTHVFRDSQGRERTERPLMIGPNAPANGPALIQINDPIAGFRYTLDTQNHIAHRLAIPQVSRGAAAEINQTCDVSTGTDTPTHQIHFSTESLGTQTMEGITVEGCRTTTTVAVGVQGNDRPLVSTAEVWRSPDLHVLVLTKNSDPRNGDTIMRLTNIAVGDPDPALFQPPPDYTIVDDKDFSTITVKVPPPEK